MGRMYTASFKSTAATAAQDLFEIASAADSVVVIHGWTVAQSTETGDAAEEMLILTTNRGTGSVTSGSGGASVTPVAINGGDAAFGGTVERNNTTVLAVGSGALTELENHTWNVRVPFQMIYPPEMRPVLSPSTYWTLELDGAPGDSVTISGTIWFEEIGG